MDHLEIRKKFLKFFEERGHKIVPSSSLIPSAEDPSLLFTTAGMQQFKDYYFGQKDPIEDFGSKNTVSVQKCFRTSDIEEVGDETHLTFFEMLGNFSFGGYFKKEAIELTYDFLTNELKIERDKIRASVFNGDNLSPFDEDSHNALIKVGFEKEKILKYGRKENFWGPTGKSGPCGRTVEFYVGGTEIWNLVFNEYNCKENGDFEMLKTPGVDTGMGLERLAMVLQNKNNIFETDLFRPIMYLISSGLEIETRRVIADHARAIVFLISDGVQPSNKEAGYILRRLIRRIITYQYLKNIGKSPQEIFEKIVEHYKYVPDYKNLNIELVNKTFEAEYEKFMKTLALGLNEFFKKYPEMEISKEKGERGKSYEYHILKSVSVKDAFYFYQTYGLTIDVIKDLAKQGGHFVDEAEFNKEFQKHREISRAGAENKFGGHGIQETRDKRQETRLVGLHTATHLLQAALREILGPEVKQMGSDIDEERTRFDFSFGRKLTEEEIKKVENRINEIIAEDLPVIKKKMSHEEALKEGALAFFKEKYPEEVAVYQAGNFSKEICAGPHVQKTGELRNFKILKEQGIGKGIRRIKGTIV